MKVMKPFIFSSAVRKTEGGGDGWQNLLLSDGRKEHLQEVGSETLRGDC